MSCGGDAYKMKSMFVKLWFAFALIVLLIAAGCAPKSSVTSKESDFVERLYANDPARKLIGTSLPAIQFKDLVTGKSTSFDDFKDKVVLINSLILGCPSCLEEIPKLNQLHDKYGSKLAIIEVDVNPKDSAEQLLETKKDLQGRDFVWTISPEVGEVLQMPYPDVTYIAKNGKIVYADSMVVPIGRLERFIEEALK